jgi:hypothetical protein
MAVGLCRALEIAVLNTGLEGFCGHVRPSLLERQA